MKTAEAANALAKAAKANIEAFYAHVEARWYVTHCEALPWSEEALRRQANEAVTAANTQTTHVAMIDALLDYENAVKMEEMVRTVREMDGKVEAKLDNLMSHVEGALRARGVTLEVIPISDEPSSPAAPLNDDF